MTLSVLLFLTLSAFPSTPRAPGFWQERRSSFGVYEGWSEARFDSWVNTSQYVTMRDGVRLAVDVTLPALGGVPTDEPLPVVWTHSRYHRTTAALAGSDSGSMVDFSSPLQALVRHGYVVAAAAVRGSGASFGVCEGLFRPAETADAIELIGWFAEQPWCDGNVGMFGGSYLGITQYMAASGAPPALKAIVPDVACFDFYDTVYPGGVMREDMLKHWDGLTRQLDNTISPLRVDGDDDGALLREAVSQHADNWPVVEGYRSAPLRDSVSPLLDWHTEGPSPLLEKIRAARVPAYHTNGWFDVFVQDSVLWFANYEAPQHLLIGDWAHAEGTAERQRLKAIEPLRWYDRWLKGIENGIEDEAPIHYMVMLEPGRSEWYEAEQWPPAGLDSTTLFLAAGPSGSVPSTNDGLLDFEVSAAGRDDYRVDPTTTTGTTSRWDNAVGAAGQMFYRNLAANDARALTWTTPPLEEELLVIGSPVVHLFVSSSSGDADLHVLLEEVAGDEVRYVTEGVLRASLRKLGQAPYDNLGLPYQRCYAEDAEPLPTDAPAEVVMDLIPTALVFDAGHRLRLTVTGADADNTIPAPGVADTTLTVYRGKEQPSRLELPVLR
jgi:putative CocE/NonD family hydrolase